ncbi:TRX domain protein [Chitinispirillum alkaliphilum]|nr:TRX domain protein [Chitinispirillum alkaliphilum]
MEKIVISVCLGTTCHLMGSSYLQNLENDLPSTFRDKVEIHWHRCLGYCRDENYGKAPFVLVGEELLSEATLFKILEKLEELTRF